MHEFENIAFLDQQKTGTTTVVNALRKLLAEKEIHADTHGPVPRGFDRDKKCFVSVRDPLSIYISLFKFGVGSKKGTLFTRLQRQDKAHYYEPTRQAFEYWLDYVLDPANADAVSGEYARSGHAEGMGVLTFRFLYLCIPKARGRLPELVDWKKLERVYERKRVFSEYVRTECLYEDLFGLLRHWEHDIRLKRPLTTLDAMIAAIKTRNASRTMKWFSGRKLSPELRKRVEEREMLLYKSFGYDQNPMGTPTSCLRGAGILQVQTTD